MWEDEGKRSSDRRIDGKGRGNPNLVSQRCDTDEVGDEVQNESP